ncbi:NUDIX domain-containing protein [Pseudonocardia kunmingensis]|uniref:NUDIX domain-containing protein n=1 Tax=Pseudonocardia kunmingensis TaxID=630975 RepID=UPI001B885499|nr:NUDIX hydrolase [Pseudonocardia kunmingensis]
MNETAAARLDATGYTAAVVLRWPHRRGGEAQCLVQLRRVAASGADPNSVVVVASELRDNPRGLGLTADVPGWTGAVLNHVVPRSVGPEQIQWLMRHGWYSTHDPAGPETLTEIEPVWDGHRFVDDLAVHRLLPRVEAQELAVRWRLEPVDVALAALGQPSPRRFGLDGQGDLVAPPLPRRRMAASMLLTDPAGAMLIVKPTYKPGWEIPGGAVEDGESPRVAAVREVAEELGIARTPGALLVIDHVPADRQRTEGLIVVFDGGQIDDPSTLVLAYAELSEYAFVTPDRLGDHLPPLQNRRALAALRARADERTIYLEDGRPVDGEPVEWRDERGAGEPAGAPTK